MPEVSQRNALFMNSEISGFTVDPEIIRRYEGMDRGRRRGARNRHFNGIAREIAPNVDGYYLMTPFGRTGLAARNRDCFHEEESA